MLKLNQSFKITFLIVIFVVVPALFLGLYSISVLNIDKIVEEAQFEVLINACIVLLCIVAIITGGLFTTTLIRQEMELVRLKDDFISRVSHELKTPLSTIRLLAEMLNSGVENKNKQQEYYQTIAQESERLSRLVDNILNFSRINSGKLQFVPRECQVNQLVNAVIDNLSLGVTGFSFKFINECGLKTIYCSPDETSQALLNLLENAIKYSSQAHCIKIILTDTKAYYRLSVLDKGIGIAEQYQQKIFEQFYRINASTANDAKGSGIGLAVVSAIARMHNGWVELKSEEGIGSNFTIVLPKPMS